MAICRKPWITPTGDIAPCGQCPECLTNRKQLWTNRNILESYAHDKKCFVTLTYSDEHIPKNQKNIPTLKKEDVQRFVKSLRYNYDDTIRYYSVGEYGTAGTRGINPHYHLLLYGIDQEHAEIINHSWRKATKRGKQGEILGFTHVGDVTEQSIAYVAGYVQKKTKYNKDMYEEFDILPEFCTMSLKPTIGANVIPKLVELFEQQPEYLTQYGDVPYSINHGSRSLPLGNYIREQVRERLNLPHDTKTFMDTETGELTTRKIWHGKEEAKAQRKKEMQLLQENEVLPDKKLTKDAQASIKHFYDYQNEQSQKNFDAKQKFAYHSHTL